MIAFDVLTLFPEFVDAGARVGVLGRAIDTGILTVRTHQLRDYTGGSPHPLDDSPYGGGPGMVMRAEPIYAAVEDVTERFSPKRRILLSPQGSPFTQATAQRLATDYDSLLLFCGRYEGVDERVRPLFDEEISIGDYVLTGGEIGALVILDAVSRLVPGVLGSSDSSSSESFSDPSLLEYPQYTRPAEFRGMPVPSVLTSGNHGEIARWRREQSLARTAARRPDLSRRSG